MTGGTEERGFLGVKGSADVWLAALAAPVAWLTSLILGYFSTALSCEAGHEWLLHSIFFLALCVAALGGRSAWKLFRATDEETRAEGASRLERSRFVAALGLLMTGLFALIIVAQWVATLVFDPCQR